MKKQLIILTVAFLVICVDAPKALCDCTFVSPYQDRNGWARWCVCMGGHIETQSGNPVCAGVSGSGSPSGGGGAASGLSQPFYNLGYSIGQSIGKALFGDPAEKARTQAEEQWRAAEQARAAEIARQEAEAREAARKAEEARKKQETFDRLSSQLQLSEGFGGNRGGLTLMLGDSDSGHVGIRGLPGIYLNDKSGNGSDKPYGIPGLPGVYVNGPGSGSGIAQPGESKLQLMLGDDNTPPATSANITRNTAPNDNIGKGRDNPYGVPGLPGVYVNGPGSGTAQRGEAKLQLMMGDDSTPPREANNTVTQPTPSTGTLGIPQPQTTIASVPASLQQQAGASKAAATAPGMEDASAKARAGFDSALPPYNSAPPSLSSGSLSSTTPVPPNPRAEQTAAVPKTLFDKPTPGSASSSFTTSGLGLKDVKTSVTVTQDQLKDSVKDHLSVDCEKATATRKHLIEGLPVLADAIKRTELQLKGAREDFSKAKVEMNLALMEAGLKEVKDYARDLIKTSEALRFQAETFSNMDRGTRDNLIRSLQGLVQHGDMIEALTRSADKAYKERHAIQKELSSLLKMISHTEKLIVESGVAAELGDILAHSGGPLAVYGFRVSKLSINWGTAFMQGRFSKAEYQQAQTNLESMREQYRSAQAKITAIEAVMDQNCKAVTRK